MSATPPIVPVRACHGKGNVDRARSLGGTKR